MLELVVYLLWALVVAAMIGAAWTTRRGRRVLRALGGFLAAADDLVSLLAILVVLAVGLAVVIVGGARAILALVGGG